MKRASVGPTSYKKYLIEDLSLKEMVRHFFNNRRVGGYGSTLLRYSGQYLTT
jgi:hypothetical protein